MTRRKVDAALKLAASLAVPASVTTPETAQAEAERWAEKRRGWVNKASAKRDGLKNAYAVKRGYSSWTALESAVAIDRVADVTRCPRGYKPRRGPKRK